MIRLVIKTTSRKKPIHSITFFKSPAGTGKKGTNADSILVKEAVSQIETIGAHLENMMAQHQTLSSYARSSSDSISTGSEVARLFELKEKGALSEQEYEAEKAKV